MLKDSNYPCGCKVRTGIDPVDGIDTTRLYACGPNAVTECVYAKAVMVTLEMMSEMDPLTTLQRKTIPRGQAPIPLVPVSDEPPEEFSGDGCVKPPEDLRLSCGCASYCAYNEEGKKQVTYVACDKGRECPNAELYLRLAESSGSPIEIRERT